MNGHRIGAAAALLALTTTVAACGDPANHPSAKRSTASSAPTAAASPSTTSTGGGTGGTTGGVSRSHPGRLIVVPADQLSPTCPRSRPAGVVCDAEHHAYRFQPEAVRTVRVVRAEADQGQAGWVVDVEADAPGRRTLSAVTTSAARTREFVLLMPRRTGPVFAAAQVAEPIRGGTVQITGTGGRAGAVRIVNQITRSAR